MDAIQNMIIGGKHQVMKNQNRNPVSECGYKCGKLPECAPLALGFVPMQQEAAPVYESNDALNRGTLFPGLDLPFKNIINKSNPYAGTPLGEVMALDFVIKELNLYLDTHKDDAEAFEMLKTYIALSKECRAEYVKRFGPLKIEDTAKFDNYMWVNGPWPWEYNERCGD